MGDQLDEEDEEHGHHGDGGGPGVDLEDVGEARLRESGERGAEELQKGRAPSIRRLPGRATQDSLEI